MEIIWPHGLERGPDGPCRELPQRFTWTSSCWCTKDGVVRRRYYNSRTGVWTWAEQPLEMIINDEGRPGYHLQWWLGIDRCICLAWGHRHEDSKNMTYHTNGKAFTAKYLRWEKPDTNAEEGEIEGEVWKPLKGVFSWNCGIVKCDSSYMISSKGRLMGPDGAVTRGFYYDGRRWAACRGAGLIDLTTCARLRENEIYLQARVLHAINAMGTGMTPVDFAMEIRVQESTAWSYFTRASQFMETSELLRTVPQVVSRDLWSILRSMSEDQRPEMGGKLAELYKVVRQGLSSRGEFRNSEFQMGQLRLARLTISKTCKGPRPLEPNWPIT